MSLLLPSCPQMQTHSKKEEARDGVSINSRHETQ
ncbi:hypothetical protein ACVMIH_007899 [Bradyrhizobium sp. USDA 4503]